MQPYTYHLTVNYANMRDVALRYISKIPTSSSDSSTFSTQNLCHKINVVKIQQNQFKKKKN